jgi:hypothetical protein
MASGTPWSLPQGHLGGPDAIQTGGTIAAPLLAGFSFTLMALVITNGGYLRWPHTALLFLLLAGLTLVGAVQCAFWARQYCVTPDLVRSWWPNLDDIGEGWTKEDQAGVYREQQEAMEAYERWASATRLLYNGGILLLLSGIAAALVPGKNSPLRGDGAAVAVAVAGGAIEAIWIVVSVATLAGVGTTSGAPRKLPRAILRVFLTVMALVLLWAGNRAFLHMQEHWARTFLRPWGSWLWSLGLLVLAGVAFGLAVLLPLRARFMPLRALVIGIVPLLMLAHATLISGPTSLTRFAGAHLRFLFNRIFFFDGPSQGAAALYVVAVFLGVAVASGFARSDAAGTPGA